VAVVLFLCACPALGTIHFRDGLTHDINYKINDDVWVDYQTLYMYTTVNLMAGGRINEPYNLQAFEDSRINMLSGSIGGILSAFGSSQVDISGGSISTIVSFNSSQIDISGGSILWNLYSYGSSQVNISGGSIGGSLCNYDSSQVNVSGGQIVDRFITLDYATLKIYGSDFAIDEQTFGYGELTSILGGHWYDEPHRHLTGTLLSGELIDNDFYIGEDARIVLVPEPASAMIIGIGGLFLFLRRRHR
jgi:hypothetical protein